MAEFLLESLLADALLLEQWGSNAADLYVQPLSPLHTVTILAWGPLRTSSSIETPCSPCASTISSATTTDSASIASTAGSSLGDDEISAAAIQDRRRRRNRESMQRARRKQKHDVEADRSLLETLSRQFARLWEQQQRRANPMGGQSRLFAQLQAAFGSLAETSNRLKAENFMLQRMVVEREKTRLKLLDAIETSDGPATAFFDYTCISLSQAQGAINACYRLIKQCEQATRPLAYWIREADGPCNTFGWTVDCDIGTSNNFFLSMTKRLPGVSPQQAMERAWTTMSSGSTHSNRHSRRSVRSEVLQTFDHSTCIVGDDVHHPTKAGAHMRSIAVRFRRTIDNGFAVGMGAVDPRLFGMATRHVQPAIEHVNVSSWHDFTLDDDGCGCVVSLKSLTQYHTDEKLHLRLTNALCSTWRWESEVMKSLARLPVI